MASSAGRTKKKDERKHAAKSGNLVSVFAVIGLVVLATFDLFSSNNVPSFVYFGLIGASLGAKIDDVQRWIGGGKQ